MATAQTVRNTLPTVYNLTTTQRTAQIWPNGQVIWDTTLLQFWLGDSQTTGGILQVSGLSDQYAHSQGYIVARHKNLETRLQQALKGATSAYAFGSNFMGNSIAEGDGSASPTNRPPAVLGADLAAYTGISSGTWPPNSYGVGGSTTATPIAMVATNLDSLNANQIGTPIRGTAWPSNTALVMYSPLITIRNDAGLIPVAKWGGWIRTLLRTLKQRGTDPILVIDPPKINITTGALLDTASNWLPWRATALRVAADEGATVVDIWGWWVELSERGFDLRQISNDGTHPNDTGNAIMTATIQQAIITPSPIYAPLANSYFDNTDGFCPTNTFIDFNGSGTVAISTLGTLIGPTDRMIQRAESTPQVYSLSSGGAVFFRCPIPWVSVIISYLAAPTFTGSPSVQMQGGTVLAPDSGSSTYTAQFIREYDERYDPSGSAVNTTQFVGVHASGGPVYVLGATFICQYIRECHQRWAACTLASNWTNTTDTYTGQSTNTISSSTVGDTCTVVWYGSSLGCCVTTGPAEGKVAIATDGGGSTTFDNYSASAQHLLPLSIFTGSNGWHTTILTVATKNGSSSGNDVTIGMWSVTSQVGNPNSMDISLNAGEVFQLPDYWTNALLIQTLSGSPTPQTNWVTGATTYTLGGSGAAVIRFSR